MANRGLYGNHSSQLQDRGFDGQFRGYHFARATDDKGHRSEEPLKTHVPPEVAEVVGELVASRQFPFSSISKLVRYLMYSNDSLEDLVLQLDKPKVKTLWTQVMAMDKILDHEESHTNFQRAVDRLGGVVSSVRDNPAKISEVVVEVYNQAKDIPDNYWRNKYLKEIEQLYGNYLPKG